MQHSMNHPPKFSLFSRDREGPGTDSVQHVEQSITSDVEKLLPSAKEVMGRIALAEAEEAEKQSKLRSEADAEKKALIDHLRQPSGIPDE
jgi:hypothetical protein